VCVFGGGRWLLRNYPSAARQLAPATTERCCNQRYGQRHLLEALQQEVAEAGGDALRQRRVRVLRDKAVRGKQSKHAGMMVAAAKGEGRARRRRGTADHRQKLPRAAGSLLQGRHYEQYSSGTCTMLYSADMGCSS
jgi:hypothetical protein